MENRFLSIDRLGMTAYVNTKTPPMKNHLPQWLLILSLMPLANGKAADSYLVEKGRTPRGNHRGPRAAAFDPPGRG